LEKKIIEILLLYCNIEVDFVDFVSEIDDNGKKIIKMENYTNVVSNEIYVHLHEDEIEFTNPIFLKIYYEIIHLLNQEQEIVPELFTNHENVEISTTVTSILMDEEQYALSDWERHDIIVKSKESNLSKLVMDVLYNLRRLLIAEKIAALKSNMSLDNDEIENQKEIVYESLEEIRDYTNLKQLLFEKLNRVL